MAKEFDTKKKINDKVREKSALTYIGYSDDIEKINHTLKEIEYNKSTGYFIIDDKKEVYGLSEDEIKEMLNISSLN